MYVSGVQLHVLHRFLGFVVLCSIDFFFLESLERLCSRVDSSSFSGEFCGHNRCESRTGMNFSFF